MVASLLPEIMAREMAREAARREHQREDASSILLVFFRGRPANT
ncbi:MAG TPA: hypothetical protein VF573_06770 [Paraburkholderia sp.]